MKIKIDTPEGFKEMFNRIHGRIGMAPQIYFTRGESGIEARMAEGYWEFVLIVTTEQINALNIGPASENPEFLPEGVEYDKNMLWENFKRQFLPDAVEVSGFLD